MHGVVGALDGILAKRPARRDFGKSGVEQKRTVLGVGDRKTSNRERRQGARVPGALLGNPVRHDAQFGIALNNVTDGINGQADFRLPAWNDNHVRRIANDPGIAGERQQVPRRDPIRQRHVRSADAIAPVASTPRKEAAHRFLDRSVKAAGLKMSRQPKSLAVGLEAT